MKIRHMRLVIPPRLRSSALFDGRAIAEAAATALHEAGHHTDSRLTLDVAGGGRPVPAIARDVAARTASMARTAKLRRR